MPSKNVQNKLCPVDYSALGRLFNVSLLHRREVAIEDNQRRIVRCRFRADLIKLAASHQRCGIGLIAHLKHCACDFRSGAPSEFDELPKGFSSLLTRGHAWKPRRAFPAHADEQGALRSRNLLLCFHQRSQADIIATSKFTGRKKLPEAGGLSSTPLYASCFHTATRLQSLALQMKQRGALHFRIIAKSTEPVNAGLLAKPRKLPLRIPARSLLYRTTRRFKRHLASYDTTQLSIPDKIEGLHIPRQASRQ